MPPSSSAAGDIHKYKPFIDGLRAVAIITVIGAHTDLPGFSGGFVGVDVFFVISGYLIINQITSDLDDKRFSIFGFYARRAFRILPAFLLVMVSTLALATLVFIPAETKEFASSFFLSSIMAANHHYMAHQGYFDMSAFTKPYLHMWSLAVEEQFYLVAPLILMGLAAMAARTGRRGAQAVWTGAAMMIAILSFAGSIAFTYPFGRANVAFYIMPTHGWEFILGGLAPRFAVMLRKTPAWTAQAMAIAGAAAIVAAVVGYDSDTLYPSYRVALPAIGATLIIVGGLADPRNSIARALATWPMVHIGLISYALYLWHWPLISFVRSANNGDLHAGAAAGVVITASVLAVLTYRFIEVPVRENRRRYLSQPVKVVAVATGSCILVATVGFLWASRISPYFLPAITGLEPLAAASSGYPPVTHHGILLGDSHAAIIQASMQELARRAGSQLTVEANAGCAPLLGVTAIDYRKTRANYCTDFLRKLDLHGAEYLIMSARWNFYLDLPPSDPFYRSLILVPQQEGAAPVDPYALLTKGLTATLAKAKEDGIQRILLVGPLPEFPWYSSHCVMTAIRVGQAGCSIPRAPVDARRKRTMEILRQVTAKFDGVRLIDPINVFCTAQTCSPHEGRKVYFFDTNHLSTAGIERLYKAFEGDFLWALTGATPQASQR